MYTQIFFVTSVVGRVFAPQMAANASESFFGAKRPFFAFFWANAAFFPAAFMAVLPRRRFSAVIFLSVAFVTVVFVVVVVVALTVVFVALAIVVFIIAIERRWEAHTP